MEVTLEKKKNQRASRREKGKQPNEVATGECRAERKEPPRKI